MSIAKTIRERRSIRTFNRNPVPRELVIQLLNDAVWAPNHGLREPWRFIYVDSEDGKVRLVDLITAASGSLKRYRLLPPKLKEFMRNRGSTIKLRLRRTSEDIWLGIFHLIY